MAYKLQLNKLRKKLFNSTIKNQKGFSLIEILIALTILGLVATFVTGKVFEQLHEGRVQATKIQMQNLKARINEFRRHCGYYPTTEQGLEALLTKPSSGRECKRYAPGGYIDGDSVPLDPWDNDYYYESDGKKFNITSFGADGIEGGEENDKDISLNEAKDS